MLGHSDLKMSARYAAYAEHDVGRRARDIFNDPEQEASQGRVASRLGPATRVVQL